MMSKAKNIVYALFHLFVAAHYIYAVFYDWVYVLPEEIKLREYAFGGKLVYLTVLNVILQAFYFTIALVNDFIGTNESAVKDRPLIRKIKDYVFATFAFPLAMDVAVLFWSMYAMDRGTVFPDDVDKFFPSWLNHIIHTNIAIFIIIELLVLHRQYPPMKESLCGLAIFMFSYLAWMHVTRYFAGKWAYPIIDTLDLPGKIGFFIFTMCYPFFMYFIGRYLNKKIWNEARLAKNFESKGGPA